MKKRILSAVLAGALALSFTGCATSGKTFEDKTSGRHIDNLGVDYGDSEDEEADTSETSYDYSSSLYHSFTFGDYRFSVPDTYYALTGSDYVMVTDSSYTMYMSVSETEMTESERELYLEEFDELIEEQGYTVVENTATYEYDGLHFVTAVYYDSSDDSNNYVMYVDPASDISLAFNTTVTDTCTKDDIDLLVAYIVESAESTIDDTAASDSDSDGIFDSYYQPEVTFADDDYEFTVSVPEDFAINYETGTTYSYYFKDTNDAYEDDYITVYTYSLSSSAYTVEDCLDLFKETTTDTVTVDSESDVQSEEIGGRTVYYKTESYNYGAYGVGNEFYDMYSVCEIEDGVFLTVNMTSYSETTCSLDTVKGFYEGIEL